MLDTAISIARGIPYKKGEQRIVALTLDRKGCILSVGKNSYTKSHPLQAKYAKMAGNAHKCFLHAEVDAIIKARKPIDKIVVCRVDSKGNAVLAAPCPVCQIAIKKAGINAIEYTV